MEFFKKVSTFFLSLLAARPSFDYGTSFAVVDPTPQIDRLAMIKAKNLVREEEGYRLDVYKDTLGILTVGIGHKVVSGDNLKFGQQITAAQAEAFFNSDIARAFDAAKAQARELKKYTPDMIAALTSVNYQLGTGWRSKFFNTWKHIKNGNISAAVVNLTTSAWKKQTPERVAAFIDTLKREFTT